MRILYVEDDPEDANLTRFELGRAAPDITLDVVGTQREALACLVRPETNRYDLVLTDMRLPDGDGLAILTHIRGRALPPAVVLVTGSGDEETAVAALKAGADDYVTKRGNYLARLPLILESALQRRRAEAVRSTQPLRVLYAEHNAADIDLTRRHLAHHAPHIHLDVVHTADEVLQRLPPHGTAAGYELLLLDYRLPGRTALELLKEVRQAHGLDLPVVLVTGQGDEEVALQALKLGAGDYLPKNAGYLYQLPSVLENVFHRSRLAREQLALRESEERFRRAFEDASIGMCLTGMDGRFLLANGALCQMLGYAREELTAKTFQDLTHPEDVEASRKWVESLLAGEPVSHHREKRYLCKDGRILWALVTTSLLRDAAGAPLHFITQIQDITHRKQLEAEREDLLVQLQRHAAELEVRVQERTRELAAANRQLAAASQAKSEFLASMSHELRTPLNSILGFSQLLLEQTQEVLPAKQTRFLTNIQNSGQHLLQLINDILDLSKVEAGRVELQLEALPVAATLEDILVIGRGLANKKGQLIETEIAPDLPPLHADPVRFKQVLFNLLSNAIKFTPAGGRITVRAYQEAGGGKQETAMTEGSSLPPAACILPSLVIAVRDTGVGIRPEDLPKLFQEFVQLETTRAQKHEGTGLGLALTKRLVELHGGRIWAESEGEGEGATFTVRLPFGQPEEGGSRQ